MSHLNQKHCESCEGIGQALNPEQILALKSQLNEAWQVDQNHLKISRLYTFKNFYETMAFVNAIAWMAHQENHHPDLEVGYNACKVTYTTHALHGLSMNDFICAAKVDHLI